MKQKNVKSIYRKTIVITALAIFSFFNVKAQKNYIITRDGQKVSIDWAASLSVSSEGYVDVYPKDNEKTPDGKKLVTYKEPKYISYEGRNWLTLPMGNAKYKYDWRIQEIICWTDKYIMTSWGFFEANSVLVFDWNLHLIKLKQARDYVELRNQRTTSTVKLNAKIFDKNLREFFADCNTIIDKVEKNNLSKEFTFTDNLTGVHCGTKDINTLIKDVISGTLDHYPTKD